MNDMTRKSDTTDELPADSLAEEILTASDEEVRQMIIAAGGDPETACDDVIALIEKLEGQSVHADGGVVDLAARRARIAGQSAPGSDGAATPEPMMFKMAARPLRKDTTSSEEDLGPAFEDIDLLHEVSTPAGLIQIHEDAGGFYALLPPDAGPATKLFLADAEFPLEWVESLGMYRITGLRRPALADFVDAEGPDPTRWRLTWS